MEAIPFGRVLNDMDILLADRVALACRYLPRPWLIKFLEREAERCEREGDLDGVLLLGLSPRGISLLQVSHGSKTLTMTLTTLR
ncbi:unnamed protein product [Discosporangium mesarthrocarpum]